MPLTTKILLDLGIVIDLATDNYEFIECLLYLVFKIMVLIGVLGFYEYRWGYQ